MAKHIAHNDGDTGSSPATASNERYVMTPEEEFFEMIRKEKEQAFYEGIDHVLDQLRLINPYGNRNGFLDD